ncbi:hypothetical protein [Variovorax sp. J31P207]|uniref:hypothetical protein n=1 Tax=Variovorax sp. J31P207 TaxID=3053510 RepID=UPI002575A746|nr:hypothetical protein [Variovorax sp. J31P207]MDM0068791.1 hypothetical protein [Variovorax sp. J31P207]
MTTLKMTPEIRGLWVAAAAAECRTLSNMFEVMVMKYCADHGVTLPPSEAAIQTTSKRDEQ